MLNSDCFKGFGTAGPPIKDMVLKNEVKKLLKRSYDAKPKNFQNFTVDKELSGKRVKVYTKNNEVYVVHRGTASFKDAYTDLQLFFGKDKNLKRLEHSRNIQNKAKEKYGKVDYTLGHSLGGYIAKDIFKKDNEGKLITYNEYVTPKSALTPKLNNHTEIRTKNDIVSMIPHLSNKRITISTQRKLLPNPIREHKIGHINNINNNETI